MRHRIVLLSTLLWSILSATALYGQETAPTDCSDTLPPRLIVTETGRVVLGGANRLRDFPSAEGNILEVIASGGEFVVINGPVCSDNFNWWFVEHVGVMGWTAEGDAESYWVEPLSAPLPDVPSATPQPPEMLDITFENVRFTLSTAIAAAAVGEVAPESLEGPVWVLAPEHVQFTLENYVVGEDVYLTGRQLHIYPAQDYERITGYALDELRQTLRHPDQPIPFGVGSPPVGAKLVFTTEPQIIPFHNGSGVRYIAHYSQGLVLLQDQELRYIFAGLTDDGQWFVRAEFALNSTLTPAANAYLDRTWFNNDAFVSAYNAYIRAAEFMIDQAPAATFEPSPEALDALIASLSIGES